MSYFDTLFNASFKGLPFAVTSTDNTHGRRLAIHKYPKRDNVWPEDMGKLPNEFTVEGFLVGDDVIAQRDLMVAVCERGGDGVLIHPTYGIMNVNLISLRTTDNVKNGRQVMLSFHFIEAGQRLFPGLVSSSLSALAQKFGDANVASAASFVDKAADLISKGQQIILDGLIPAATFVALGGGLTKTASNIFRASSSLPGYFGRFFGASTGSASSSIVGNPIPAANLSVKLNNLIEAGVTAQAAVEVAASNVDSAIRSGVANNMTSSIQDYVSAIASSVVNPADAITILSNMMSVYDVPVSGTSTIGSYQDEFRNAIASLCRRSAAARVALASSYYQPISQNDAYDTMNRVTDALDIEISYAGDHGDDDVFLALKRLRAEVVKDLSVRGSSLAVIVQKKYNDTMPALNIAYRLYGDITRTDQVVSFANPVHPAFMPIEFPALSS
jgi:prophage DNA circulation protein